MNPIIEQLMGIDVLTDQVVATDLLIAAKSAVRNYAMAVTESGTPEIKEVLTRHLEESLDMYEHISNYMMEKGWYHGSNIDEQIKLDLQNIDTALKLPTI